MIFLTTAASTKDKTKGSWERMFLVHLKGKKTPAQLAGDMDMQEHMCYIQGNRVPFRGLYNTVLFYLHKFFIGKK